MNKRDLKAYSRFDATGRIVPGSTVLRRQKPKVGNWKEVSAYECCNVDQQTIQVNIQDAFPFGAASIEIGPAMSGDFFQPIRSYGNDNVADIDELLVALSKFKNLGKFKIVDGDIYLTPTIEIAEFYQGNNTVGLYAYAFSD